METTPWTKLDDPELVRREYADEAELESRNRAYATYLRGPSASDAALDAVAAVTPRRVLDAGCGTGEFAERVRSRTGAAVVGLDLSPRMVELTSERGIQAVLGDVQDLPFAEGEFDCAIANWVLFHVPDVGRSLDELARVLGPGGRLVAGTLHGPGERPELDELIGATEAEAAYGFSGIAGASLLDERFRRVERLDVAGELVFPDHLATRRYVASLPTRRHLAVRVPAFEGAFRTAIVTTVFVADEPVRRRSEGPRRETGPLDRG